MKRAIKSSGLALLAFMFSFYLSYGAENVPQTIRIGLTFDNPSVESVAVASSEGFEFGVVNGDNYENLCPYIDFKKLRIEKASDFDESVFLVKAGSVSEDLQSLSDDIAMLEDMDEVFFSIYDDGWSMCAGPYSSKSEAESKAKSFSNETDKIDFNVSEYDSLILVESEGGTVLAYDSMRNEYLIKPFGEKNEDSVFSYNGHQYRGGVMIKRYVGSDLTVINYLDMNEYLYGVLPWEMSNSWPLEALKAQAIAARNFAISNYSKYSYLGFNLCGTNNSQAYVGYDYEGPVCNRAVDETEGQLLMWNGNVVSAFYHANSGGFTENSENIWSTEVPYLKGIRDDFSAGGPHYSWEIKYSEDSIYEIMRSAGYDVGKSIDMSIARRSENNHVLELLIESEKADVKLLKNAMRTVFGYDKLKSTLFEIRKDNDLYCINRGTSIERIPAKGISVLSGNGKISKTDFENCHVLGEFGEKENPGAKGFVIEGRGWGHGLGMSQEGAKAMAEEGYGYRDILSFYYTDTTIE
ncbi:MAG: SpoIID/LytB domain-containing protein [Peptostreptococcaceae bacterium]|nr:SpoIID/LytB domain-containing protein [Peptostreptococcaceae bacterium]